MMSVASSELKTLQTASSATVMTPSDIVYSCSAVHRSIKKFTDEYKQKKYPIHVLLNNAAIQSPKGKRGAKTEEGFEV